MLSKWDLKIPRVESKRLFLNNVLLLSCTKTWDLKYSQCSVMCYMESSNLHLLYSGTIRGACRNRYWMFARRTRNFALSPTRFSKFLCLLKASTHLKVNVRAQGVLWYLICKLVVIVGTDCIWAYTVTYCTFSWKLNGQIYILRL